VTELRIELEQPLPERVAVGPGSALSLSGFIRGNGAIAVEGLLIEHDQNRPAVSASTLPPRLGQREQGRAWSAIVPIESVEKPNPLRLRVRAELAGGGEAEIELGRLEIRPGLGAEYRGELRPTRHRAAVGARKLKESHPGRPVVAIAMATHEPPRELFERQIESIRGQTHEGWVCLISDDRSSEASLREMRAVIGDDPRFLLWPSSQRRGPVHNFERALSMVPESVDLVAPADQTGYWYPQKLEVLSANVHGDVSLAYADMRMMSVEGEVLAERWCDPRRSRNAGLTSLLLSNFVPGSNALLRREVLEDALPFPPRGGAGRHDHWLALVAMTRGRLSFDDLLLADHHAGSNKTNLAAGRWQQAGGRRPRWRDVYLGEYHRMAVAATVLRMRGGDRLGKEQLEALEEALGIESGSLFRLRLQQTGARFSRSPERKQQGRLLSAVAKRRSAEKRSGALRRVWRSLRGRSHPDLDVSAGVAEPDLGASTAAEPEPDRSGAGSTNGASADEAHPPRGDRLGIDERELAIDVRDLHKTYELPSQTRPRTWKARVRHPLGGRGTLTVLDGISFQVRRGELFGILGRNGSGKSTLLRILAGIYGYDSGRVRVSPRIAPVIELGVGFQPEFPALKNVIQNAEFMGIPESQARRRFDSIIEFAGLGDFVDLKLRNYSSGMRARLAFAIAINVDADLLLLDEVLAVGDPAFQRKCEAVFEERKASRETTIILVTQTPSRVQRHCDRALLLEGGRIEWIGDSRDVVRRYAEISLEHRGSDVAGPHTATAPGQARIVDLWLEDEDQNRATSVLSGEDIRLRASIEASSAIEEPGLRLEIRNKANAKIFAPPTLEFAHGRPSLAPRERLMVEAGIENKLAPGPYTVICSVCGLKDGVERAVSAVETTEFIVVGDAIPTEGVIHLDHDLRISVGADDSIERRGPGRAE
jgi:ABC-type polysaccharide/polyol phosphate transport system ATPase subunit